MTPARFEEKFIRVICYALATIVFVVLNENANLHVRFRFDDWALMGIQFFAILGLVTGALNVADRLSKLNRPVVEPD
jgi:hypothetical protein